MMNTTQKIPLDLDQNWTSYEFCKLDEMIEEIKMK